MEGTASAVPFLMLIQSKVDTGAGEYRGAVERVAIFGSTGTRAGRLTYR